MVNLFRKFDYEGVVTIHESDLTVPWYPDMARGERFAIRLIRMS